MIALLSATRSFPNGAEGARVQPSLGAASRTLPVARIVGCALAHRTQERAPRREKQDVLGFILTKKRFFCTLPLDTPRLLVRIMPTPSDEILDQELTGRALQILRAARGLRQTEVAEQAGFGVSQLSRYERQGSSPTLESLERLMRALDLPMEALLEAKRFVRWITESARHGRGHSTPGSAPKLPDEVREPPAPWQAEPSEGGARAEELARLFRAWIREEVARTVDRE